MVERLYSDFDTDISIAPVNRKTFLLSEIDTVQLKQITGVNSVIPAVEEMVVLKHEKKWANAKLLGLDEDFLKVSSMPGHIVDGFSALQEKGEVRLLVGASLLDQLEGFVPSLGYEELMVYAPKRDMKMRFGKSPFKTKRYKISGRFNFNREVNSQFALLPLKEAQRLLGMTGECTHLFIDHDSSVEGEHLAMELQKVLGKDFSVQTRYQKNALIYKTSQSEKMIVMVILIFVFVIAAFTLVAALTMLYIEKKGNFYTLRAFGASDSFLLRILLLEGLIIAGRGVLFGLLIGYAVCFGQLFFEWLQMPNSNGEPFPIRLKWTDAVFIFSTVSVLSFASAYLPSKFLMRSFQRSVAKL